MAQMNDTNPSFSESIAPPSKATKGENEDDQQRTPKRRICETEVLDYNTDHNESTKLLKVPKEASPTTYSATPPNPKTLEKDSIPLLDNVSDKATNKVFTSSSNLYNDLSENIPIELPFHTQASLGHKLISIKPSWLKQNPWSTELFVEHGWLDHHYLNDMDNTPLGSPPQKLAWEMWQDDNTFFDKNSGFISNTQKASRDELPAHNNNKLYNNIFYSIPDFADHYEHIINPEFCLTPRNQEEISPKAQVNTEVRIEESKSRINRFHNHIGTDLRDSNKGKNPTFTDRHKTENKGYNPEETSKKPKSHYLKAFLKKDYCLESLRDSARPGKCIEGFPSPLSPDAEYFEYQAKFGNNKFNWERETNPLGYIPPMCNCENEEYWILYNNSLQQDENGTPKDKSPDVLHSFEATPFLQLRAQDYSNISPQNQFDTANNQQKNLKPTTLDQLPSVCPNKSCQGLLFIPYSFIEVPLNHDIDNIISFCKKVLVPPDTEIYCGNTKHTALVVVRSPEHEYLCWKALQIKSMADSCLIYDVDPLSFQPFYKPFSSSNSVENLAKTSPTANSFSSLGNHQESSYNMRNPAKLIDPLKGISIKSFSYHRRPLKLSLRNIHLPEDVDRLFVESPEKQMISCQSAFSRLWEEASVSSSDISYSDVSEIIADELSMIDKEPMSCSTPEQKSHLNNELLDTLDKLLRMSKQTDTLFDDNASLNSYDSLNETDMKQIAFADVYNHQRYSDEAKVLETLTSSQNNIPAQATDISQISHEEQNSQGSLDKKRNDFINKKPDDPSLSQEIPHESIVKYKKDERDSSTKFDTFKIIQEEKNLNYHINSNLSNSLLTANPEKQKQVNDKEARSNRSKAFTNDNIKQDHGSTKDYGVMIRSIINPDILIEAHDDMIPVLCDALDEFFLARKLKTLCLKSRCFLRKTEKRGCFYFYLSSELPKNYQSFYINIDSHMWNFRICSELTSSPVLEQPKKLSNITESSNLKINKPITHKNPDILPDEKGITAYN